METICIYDLEFDLDGICCLRKQKCTGYAKGFTVESTKVAVNMINNIFYPSLKVERYDYMIACDNDMKILGLFIVAYGGVNITVTNMRSILLKAMMCNASIVILVRNDPIGDCCIGKEELDGFKKLKKIAKAVGVTVKDNIIISKEKYLSFTEEGIE